jgi:hypothetical protein
MDKSAARDRFVQVVRDLAAEKATDLERLKEEASGLERPDFMWHYLLQSFSTMGRAAGWHGLIGRQANYDRVTYPVLAALTPVARRQQVEQVCRAAHLRMPDRKATFICACFDYLQDLGGPEAAKGLLLAQQGRDAKIRFLQKFPGIGPKYARNIMMDVYHQDFRDSIALDVRILAISKALGLTFPTYAAHEQFYLGVARDAGINGWELDRLLFNFRQEVESRLGISAHPVQRTSPRESPRSACETSKQTDAALDHEHRRLAPDMTPIANRIVPEDPANPGYDVLIGRIGARSHYIHCAMAAATGPLTPSEIGVRAEELARAGGYSVKRTTFSSSVTSSHLNSMRNKRGRGFAEPLGEGRWQLTESARRLIASVRGG